MLDQRPDLVAGRLRVGASRQDPGPYFLIPIHHYVYAGDTALHVAAAAAQDRRIADLLVANGADVFARNRRGAEPLHYAADGRLAEDHWDSDRQRKLIS
jgi:Ankyrin repeats (many copies)